MVVSFFESVVRDHSKDHPMAVTYVSSDTLTGIRTPLCRTQLEYYRQIIARQQPLPGELALHRTRGALDLGRSGLGGGQQ